MGDPLVLSRRQLLERGLTGSTVLAALPWMVPDVLAGTPSRTAASPTTAPGARPAGVAAFDAGVATAWFDELLLLIRDTPGFSPPVASRAIGYAGCALYEALLPGMPDHRSSAGLLTELRALPGAGQNIAYAWPVVANAALAGILRDLFPTAPAHRQAAIDTLEASLAATAPRGIRERSIDRGRQVAEAIFAWSTTDGGHEGYLRNVAPDYVPPVGPGLWVPTPPGHAPALQPAWGGNRTFIPGAAGVPIADPIPYSLEPGTACHAEGLEVFETVNGLSSEQTAIARFWSDDPRVTATPPGHTISILTQALRTTDASLEVAAELYLRVGIAIADAFIACWRTKFRHNVLRPITYIRQAFDPSWGAAMPLVTPPFPEYTSGHSVQSAAGATVMTAGLGPIAFIDRTHEARGLTARTFESFETAAEEAAISRLYGGIHFRAGIERGLAQGRAIGRLAADLPLRA